ncbi:uncharacterized protein LOC126833392 [Adelges cooleyi]|uniref:uncharacterized protein LOC126833392 n=1 Tax=Adelges cooleyi TaxID=133065 RepID=UPI00218036AA|nr:uncharacterized protein LOC126833392 [Adelges cooleyi]XP_050420652.1 uncharacterized protein LOC126833392 [Adelges cooleyi]
MKKGSPCSSNNFWDIVPEVDQHEVRYSEYIIRTPKRKSLDKRKRLSYGVGPLIESEIDDDGNTPNYAEYIILHSPERDESNAPNTSNAEGLPKTKSKRKKNIEELSFVDVVRLMKGITVKSITKFLDKHQHDFIKLKQNPPDPTYLQTAYNLYEKMFNAGQKVSMYVTLKSFFNIPPHQFTGTQFLFDVMVREAAVLLFQKKFKLKSKKIAIDKFLFLSFSDLK